MLDERFHFAGACKPFSTGGAPTGRVDLLSSTASGHIEQSSVSKQRRRACKLAEVDFALYTFRHTALTRWSEVLDPYTLMFLTLHGDFAKPAR
jgi:hypothetical protein